MDIKSSNILLRKIDSNKYKFAIGDFGLAAFANELDLIENEGDRSYLAPEILNGIYGKFNDIFR